MSDACESGFYWAEGTILRLSGRPELYIARLFMLHLVAFALPGLFVSLGDVVALGIVLRWI